MVSSLDITGFDVMLFSMDQDFIGFLLLLAGSSPKSDINIVIVKS